MKLAEALLLRADMKKKLASLRERITANAIVQQGEKPHEDPVKLMKEGVAVLDRMERLVLAINGANLSHKLRDGRTLAAVIARRDKLVQQHSLLQTGIEGSKRDPIRYGLKEIKWVTKVDVSKLQKQSDDLARQIREINAVIQETNWQIEVEVETE
jgi:hypothetical protein